MSGADTWWRLAAARTFLGIEQRRVAIRLGLARSTLCRIEKGKATPPEGLAARYRRALADLLAGGEGGAR